MLQWILLKKGYRCVINHQLQIVFNTSNYNITKYKISHLSCFKINGSANITSEIKAGEENWKHDRYNFYFCAHTKQSLLQHDKNKNLDNSLPLISRFTHMAFPPRWSCTDL